MIPVFEANPHVAARLQDAIAAHMLASLPRLMRRHVVYQAPRIPPPSKDGNTAQIAKRAAERQALIPVVMQLRAEGMLQKDIASKLKISPDRLRLIMKEAGVETSSNAGNDIKAAKAAAMRASIAPEVIRMIEAGGSKAGAARALKVDRTMIDRIVREWSARVAA